MTTVIYRLVDGADTYYVGLSDCKPGEAPEFVAERRRMQHWADRWRENTPKAWWLRTLQRPPECIVIDVVDDAIAATVERHYIEQYALRGHPLTNVLHNPRNPYFVPSYPSRRPQPWPWGKWTRTAASIIGRWMWRELRKSL